MGVTLLICSLVYLIMTTFVYFSKQRLDSREIKIYNYLIISSFVGIFLELACILIVPIRNDYPIINEIINRSFLLYILVWVSLFTLYVFTISFYNDNKASEFVKKHIKKFKILELIVFILFAILLVVLPLNYYYDGQFVYSYGLATSFLYFVNSFLIIVWIVCILINIRVVNYKKSIPIFTFIFTALLNLFVREINPGILLITVSQTFITIMMYFTIENPDVKMINYLNFAKDTAEKANRAKSDFLSSMSHEIRTPLNAIVGFSECIVNADDLNEAKENASDVISASKTLLEIVNGILDISKIEAGKLELVETDYSTKKLFDDVVKLIQIRIGDKPLNFKVNIAEDLPPVLYGDHTNVKKILINLLTNAVKYTDQGFISLDVKCVKNDDICRLIVSVKDSGRGIKQEDIGKLFSKFQRVDEDRNTTIEGTGLGLAITKQLVEMMNGKIVVNSIYNEGSEFKIAIDQRLSLAKIEEEKEDNDNVDVDLTNKRILVVDDNKLNLKVVQKLLVKYNPIITTVESGIECLNLITNGNKYDLILLDDMMPKMRGTETLIRLKKIPGFNIPTIALTANAINGMKEQYLKDGFDDYLSKPIEKNELLHILKKYIVNSDKITVNVTNPSTDSINSDVISYKDYSNKKILIVDDNKINITIAINFLKPYKFMIESCLSGIDCLNLINSGKVYDLIFVDIMMPEMDGVTLLNKLKQIPNFSTKVIALTADAVEGAKEKYLGCGFDGYIAKPIDRKELNSILDDIFSNSNTIKNNIEYLKQNGVDIDKSLELLGDINTYNDLLKEFMATIKDKVNNLYRYKNNNDLVNYAILVHSLKSDSRYLGFTKLADIALNHELKSKENDLTYINNNFNLLLNEVREVINIANKYLN